MSNDKSTHVPLYDAHAYKYVYSIVVIENNASLPISAYWNFSLCHGTTHLGLTRDIIAERYGKPGFGYAAESQLPDCFALVCSVNQQI